MWYYLCIHASRNVYIVNKLKDLHQPKESRKSPQFYQEDNVERLFEGLIKDLLEILMENSDQNMNYHELLVAGLVCENLEFIKKKICPDVLKKVLDDQEVNPDQFEDQYVVILQASRVLNLWYEGSAYHKYIIQDNHAILKNNAQNDVKSTYQELRKKLVKISQGLSETYSRIKERDDRLSLWLLDQEEIKLVFEKDVNSYLQKLDGCIQDENR
jgi:hypothetical protein